MVVRLKMCLYESFPRIGHEVRRREKVSYVTSVLRSNVGTRGSSVLRTDCVDAEVLCCPSHLTGVSLIRTPDSRFSTDSVSVRYWF